MFTFDAFTFLRSRADCACCKTSIASMDGTASFLFSHLLVLNFSPPSRLISGRCSKKCCSKCTEQRVDFFDGCQLGRCLRTKRVHFSRKGPSFGNVAWRFPLYSNYFYSLSYLGPLPHNTFHGTRFYARQTHHYLVMPSLFIWTDEIEYNH